MVAAIVLVALAALVVVGVVSVTLTRQAARGWQQASESERHVRELLIARVTTLENRLMTHTWQDFTSVQHSPDETAKIAWAESQFREQPVSVGHRPEDRVATQVRSDGSDLEGDIFEGPTLG